MGKLQERLDEFQLQNVTVYDEIMNILEDKYCWKCPMLTTSKNSRCREIHAGKVLCEVIDKVITTKLNENNINPIEIEAIIIRILKKKIKKQGGRQREKNIILNIEAEQNQDLSSYNQLMIKINPRKVQKGDNILIPDKSVESTLLGAYALVAGLPFHVAVVEKFFHKGNFWYVEIEDEQILPLESIFGVLIKVIGEEDSL